MAELTTINYAGVHRLTLRPEQLLDEHEESTYRLRVEVKGVEVLSVSHQLTGSSGHIPIRKMADRLRQIEAKDEERYFRCPLLSIGLVPRKKVVLPTDEVIDWNGAVQCRFFLLQGSLREMEGAFEGFWGFAGNCHPEAVRAFGEHLYQESRAAYEVDRRAVFPESYPPQI